MPELPDVELFKRYLDARALHQTIADVVVDDARVLDAVSPKALAVRLRGRHFLSSRRHGKHLFVELDRSGWLTLHFGMTGALAYFESMADEPRYDRVRFDFETGAHLAYTSMRMLGRVGLTDDADAFITREGLGLDALDEHLTVAAFTEALGKGRRSVKTALMDQTAIAGIGNIYSDEILFQAGLHPSTPVRALTTADVARLSEESRKVLETAVRLGAGSEQFLDRLPAGYLLPNRKEVAICPRCGDEIRTLKVSGRTAYYCTTCQPPQRA